MTLLAATAVALAFLIWRPPHRLLIAARLGHHTQVRPRLPLRSVALAAVPIGALATTVRPALVIIALAAAAVVAVAAHRWRCQRRSSRVERREAQITELVLVLAAALRAGIPAPVAMAQVAREFTVLEPAAHAARLGGQVPVTLARLGEGEGGAGLRRLAAAWQVAETTGASMADVLDRLSITEREEREVRREVRSGVAPARATASLMALLPVLGLFLGSGLGGDPLALILHEVLVASAVTLGVGLACLGVWWIDRIVDAAESGQQ